MLWRVQIGHISTKLCAVIDRCFSRKRRSWSKSRPNIGHRFGLVPTYLASFHHRRRCNRRVNSPKCPGNVSLSRWTVRSAYSRKLPAYVDTNLVGTGKVSKAAIIGLADKNVWAKSADLDVSHFVHRHHTLACIQAGAVARHLRPLVTPTYAELCFCLLCTQISSDELKALATAFDDPDKVQGSGLRISNQKYFTLLINRETGEESIQLKQGVSPNSILPFQLPIYLDYIPDASFLIYVAQRRLRMQDESSGYSRCLFGADPTIRMLHHRLHSRSIPQQPGLLDP